MKTLQRAAIIFIASLVVARLVGVFLSSRAGKRAARSVGLDSLLTPEGVEAAKRYSKAATGLLLGTVLTIRAQRSDEAGQRHGGFVRVAENAGEMAIAIGTLAKIVADFLREERDMHQTEVPF